MCLRREDICQKDKVCFILRSRWEKQGVEVCPRYSDVLCLTSLVWTHGNVSVCGTGESVGLVGFRTEGSPSLLAIGAVTAGNVKWHHDTITLFERLNSATDLFDNSLDDRSARSAGVRRNNTMFSCPKMMPASAAVLPSYMCKSDPQMAAVVTLTITSFGPWMPGFWTSSTSTLNGPFQTTAFIADFVDVLDMFANRLCLTCFAVGSIED